MSEHDSHHMTIPAESSVDDLAAILKGSDTDLSGVVCHRLGEIGTEPALALLTESLNDRDVSVRRDAALGLAHAGNPASAPALIESGLKNEDEDTRKLAAYALGNIANKVAVGPLIDVMTNSAEAPGVRGQAAEALGMIRRRRAVDPLIAVLQDPSTEVRFWAAFALGQVGNARRALPELRRLAASDSGVLPDWGSVREEARMAIENIERTRKKSTGASQMNE